MVPKKPTRKKVARGRPSLMSSSLAGAVYGAAQANVAQEPWRNRKPMGRNGGDGKK